MSGDAAAAYQADLADTELGRERRCRRCREWWPQDEEFYFRQHRRHNRSGFQAICKACYYEQFRYRTAS